MVQPKMYEMYSETGLSSNMEDYMEAITLLARENRVVRVKDIAKKLNIKMPSVTAALNKLKDMELIEYEKYGFVELTEEGRKVADSVYQRHACLSDFFENVLQLDCTNADAEACKVEHHLVADTCFQLHKFLEFFKAEEQKDEAWIRRLKKALK